jgi:predicted flavoprotein YhiN
MERGLIVKTFKNFEVNAKNIYGFDKALITRGGVSLKEIDHRTMKSKIIDFTIKNKLQQLAKHLDTVLEI